MSIALEAYTVEGMLTGSVAAEGRLLDVLGTCPSIVVESATYTPLEGAVHREGWAGVEVDDILMAAAPPETVIPVHYAWHDLTMELGPFLVHGLLPCLPGFDPSKALARPTGPFVLLSQVTVELRGRGREAGENAHEFAYVNRYAVEYVESDLELGFFFPGAREVIKAAALAS
jgi:hypothetical protein